MLRWQCCYSNDAMLFRAIVSFIAQYRHRVIAPSLYWLHSKRITFPAVIAHLRVRWREDNRDFLLWVLNFIELDNFTFFLIILSKKQERITSIEGLYSVFIGAVHGSGIHALTNANISQENKIHVIILYVIFIYIKIKVWY